MGSYTITVPNIAIPQRLTATAPEPRLYTRDRGGREAALVERAISDHGAFPEKPLSFIYFIQAIEEGGPIKIGRARDPVKRRVELQVGSPLVIGITRVVVGHPDEEARLHELFKPMRLHGEWFKPHPVIASLADARADSLLADVAITVPSG